MKKIILILMLLAPCARAASRDLVKMAPRDSLFVLAADVDQLRDNEVFSSMEKKDQIWAYDEDSGIGPTLRSLKIDTKTDIKAFLYSRYINPYGNKGKVHVFELKRDISDEFVGKESTAYLDAKLYRLFPNEDVYAAPISSSAIALGSLTGVKAAVDVSRNKQPGLSANDDFKAAFDKMPAEAAFWGFAEPLSRREAANKGAEQSTNAMLEAFDHYSYYGIPKDKSVKCHFIGVAKGESEAAFVSTFMIGTLTFAKFRVDDQVGEMLDTVDIQRDERNIHVTATVTKELVNAYFKGDLGVK